MRKPDSERFLELQRASTRDVKAVGMVAASTGLEMVEYIRTLEQTSIPRATVAAALRELRADFLKARDLHSVAASDKDYEGEYETGMRLSAAAVAWQDATNRLDATIAKLGLEEM